MNLATLKLIGIGVGALAVVALLAMVLGWRTQARERGEKLAVICQTVRDASANPKLKCGDAAVQIAELGKSVASMKAALAKQNAAVNALADASAKAQDEAARAVLNAQGRARAAQATSDRLAASSRAGEAQTKPCLPSKALTEAWR